MKQQNWNTAWIGHHGEGGRDKSNTTSNVKCKQ